MFWDIDFTQHWLKADVVLKTQNYQDVGLHASKAFLAVYSPYFDKMFFGEFKENNATEVQLRGEDFTVVHLALKILHQTERQGGPSQDYTPDQLRQLYEFADRCDVPLIRDFCNNQLEKSKVKEALEVAVKLQLYDVKSKLVKSLDKGTLQDYLDTNTSEATFSVADVKVLLKKMTFF